VNEFPLQKRIILFYGPNGSAKTSFCEGLEYALIGSVEEADTNRIEPRVYLANIHAARFAAPFLLATSHQNREMPVAANIDTFPFCFIEKNRIDAFSPASQPGHPNTPLLVDAYGRILGIPADNLVWSYLNKGTHEEADRDNFDGDLVEQVVQTLEALDALDLRNSR
jgi:hypothetical protein